MPYFLEVTSLKSKYIKNKYKTDKFIIFYDKISVK